jgi:hypothetical protein
MNFAHLMDPADKVVKLTHQEFRLQSCIRSHMHSCEKVKKVFTIKQEREELF